MGKFLERGNNLCCCLNFPNTTVDFKLIFHRILHLVIGFTLVHLFAGWGLTAYLVFFVIYCRVVMSLKMSITSQTSRVNHSITDKYVYTLFIMMGLVVLTIISSKFWFDVGVITENIFSQKRYVEISPHCKDTVYSQEKFLNCKSYKTSIEITLLLAPVIISAYFSDLLESVRLPVEVGFKNLIYLFLLTSIICIAPWYFSGTLKHISYRSLEFTILFICFQLFLVVIWLRLRA